MIDQRSTMPCESSKTSQLFKESSKQRRRPRYEFENITRPAELNFAGIDFNPVALYHCIWCENDYYGSEYFFLSRRRTRAFGYCPNCGFEKMFHYDEDYWEE